jgi:hypothetical protein
MLSERNPQPNSIRRLGTDGALVRHDGAGFIAHGLYARGKDGVVRLVDLVFEGDDLTSGDVYPFRQLRAGAEWMLLAQSGPVPEVTSRPDGTDEWWERFALAFQQWKAQGLSSEAIRAALEQQIGEDLPLATLHRWSTEARRRGLLPATSRTRKDKR